MVLSTSKVITIGGHGCPVQTGNILKARQVILKDLKDTRWFMLRMKMQKRMQNGLVKNCRQKPNGSLQQEEDWKENRLPGVMKIHSLPNRWQIHGRENFHTKIY